ncbi:hypothetical protein X735_01310 [Mesorhizobium sp. L2C085B000]|uniref:hypothetical protein n=1 Tax=Mesorhizobium sp. L2C085B000 TaxID=1287117 RepID=UPI0003CFA4EF|nr:hypothetical protein [Mesorhizobium sp. L2C085B000]ESZ15596.1 hypothetical protein X735_01310 [Mesorhizobium sp. L2C085B000]
MTKFFVDADGVYLGGFDGENVDLPQNGVQVLEAPADARQLWDGKAWSAPPAERRMVPKSVVQARIIEAGKMSQAYAALAGNPIYFARWFAPDRPEVYSDDPDAVGLVRALGLDPAVILAP